MESHPGYNYECVITLNYVEYSLKLKSMCGCCAHNVSTPGHTPPTH